MPAPALVGVRLADGLNCWYVVSALYPSAYAARKAWERVERKTPKGALGLYRHGPQGDGRVVTVVSLDRAQVLRCAGLLRLGEDYRLDPTTARALIARRAQVVLAHRGEPAGRVKWRRPDARAARLTPEGDMIEPGGHG